MKISVISYLAGFVAYLFLSFLLLKAWRGNEKGRWLAAASLATTIWAGGITLQEVYGRLPVSFIWCLEWLHTYAWLVFFSKLLHRDDGNASIGTRDFIGWGIQTLSLAQGAFVWVSPLLQRVNPEVFRPSDLFFGYLLMAVVGLAMVEQYFRNAQIDKRWRIKFLCFALGALFVYDFYLYSEALLLHHIREDLWAARGAIAAMTTPLIALSAARNADWSVNIFVSRQVVFHSAALLGTAAYLLVMAGAGYYIKYYGGEWGTFVQIIFLVGAFLLLALVLFSGQIRASVRLFISKNFFSNTYDYREEWLRLIATLSQGGSGLTLEERVIQALGQVVGSSGGVLWGREPMGRLVWRASYGDPGIDTRFVDANDPVVRYLEHEERILNLKELAAVPEAYGGLSRPAWLERHDNAWLLIPLFHHAKTMDGLVLLTWPQLPFAWNWEVVEMLKTSSRLAASYLALEHAGKELAEAQLFDGFNRLAAFVIHDLKNLVAQLSLVVHNAEKHQDNPVFMRDAIKTVDHAVSKMNALMAQLRNPISGITKSEFDLNELLREVIEARKKQLPVPQCDLENETLMVCANRERLASALEHVIQNGQDAAGKQGRVVIRLRSENRHMASIEVEDDGCGMDDHFIRTRLFKPFDTTKGLAGMGIGAYESREYIRSLGGDLNVHSRPGKGSLFHFMIPLAESEKVVSLHRRSSRP